VGRGSKALCISAPHLRSSLAQHRLICLANHGRCRGHATGNYIVDFCAPRKKLIIELDESQHLDQKEYDDERTKYFEARGYRVLRFWINEVMNNAENVLKVIWDVLSGAEWSRVAAPYPGLGGRFNGVAAAPARDVWAVGYFNDGNQNLTWIDRYTTP
jgi:very-short-patch-repair endonuclease